jgi:hypothetical protein
MKELSVIQRTYDCIKWYVPIIERLPKIHKFTLGDRIRGESSEAAMSRHATPGNATQRDVNC